MLKRCIPVALFLCCFCVPGIASSKINPEIVELSSRLGKSFAENLDISRSQNERFSVRVRADLDLKSGRLKNIELFIPSVDPQTNLDVLDAVSSIDRLSTPGVIGEDSPIEIEFGTGKYANGYQSFYFDRFKRTKSPKAGFSFFHSIPLSVLEKYPGVFTYDELSSEVHLRSLANTRITSAEVKKLRRDWLAFFDTHNTAKKEELLDLEKRVDRQSGLSTR